MGGHLLKSPTNFKNMEDKFFHGECKVVEREIFVRVYPYKGAKYLTGAYCLDHHVEICRCGWEWGFHGGSNSDLAWSKREKLDNPIT